MKYQYTYRTSSNEQRSGMIVAKNRSDVYEQLRKQGIRPSRVVGRDPIQWRRWAVISVLLVALAAALWYGRSGGSPVANPVEEDRAQLYGDASLIQKLSIDGWRKTFPDARDAWFARHAVPAVECDCDKFAVLDIAKFFVATGAVMRIDVGPNLAVATDERPELAKMKRMINGMKREMRTYVDGAGSVVDYIRLCDERIAKEKAICESAKKEFDFLQKQFHSVEFLRFVELWDRKNDRLREMGLPTVPVPEN